MGWGNKQQVEMVNKTTGIEKSKIIHRPAPKTPWVREVGALL
jgi:hypothetical protein